MNVVCSIAGSDSSGGAGIQADLKTIEAFGLYGETVLTVLTAQNTLGVTDIFEVSPEFVQAQLAAVFDDIVPDALKIGMVYSPEIVAAVAQALDKAPERPLVLDPVMVATSGSSLTQDATQDASIELLFPKATVITPNLPEAEVLVGDRFHHDEDVERAADKLAELTSGAVLIKGGHDEDRADDFLRLPDGCGIWLSGDRIDNPNSHGTGCSLSSAIACGLAEGKSVEDAVRAAKAYVAGALSAGLDLGKGSGPLDHQWQCRTAI